VLLEGLLADEAQHQQLQRVEQGLREHHAGGVDLPAEVEQRHRRGHAHVLVVADAAVIWEPDQELDVEQVDHVGHVVAELHLLDQRIQQHARRHFMELLEEAREVPQHEFAHALLLVLLDQVEDQRLQNSLSLRQLDLLIQLQELEAQRKRQVPLYQSARVHA